MRAGLFLIGLLPNLAIAQSSINGTWKLDVGTLPMSTDALVWLLQDGRYQCKSCMPLIDVKADGQDQSVSGPYYDTLNVTVVDDRTVLRAANGGAAHRTTIGGAAPGSGNRSPAERVRRHR